MKRFSFLFLLIIFSFISCQKKTYLVTEVVDGDTIKVEGIGEVRYIGLDTPETYIRQEDSTWSHQPESYAEDSKEFNRKLVEGKRVRLEYDVVKKDKYNRTLAYVYAGDTFVNAELIKQGYALLFTYPPNIKYVDLFIKLQKEARENNRGLWAEVEAGSILPEDAYKFIDKIKIVEGEVVNIDESKKVIYLKFGKGKKDFRVVIFKNNLPIFKRYKIDPAGYLNQKVRVSGKIKKYKNSIEIIADTPNQIEIIY